MRTGFLNNNSQIWVLIGIRKGFWCPICKSGMSIIQDDKNLIENMCMTDCECVKCKKIFTNMWDGNKNKELYTLRVKDITLIKEYL